MFLQAELNVVCGADVTLVGKSFTSDNIRVPHFKNIYDKSSVAKAMEDTLHEAVSI